MKKTFYRIDLSKLATDLDARPKVPGQPGLTPVLWAEYPVLWPSANPHGPQVGNTPQSASSVNTPCININLLRRPLWHPNTVEECLDITRPKLNSMVECGELAWAWDLGTGRKRKEVRILGHCVVEHAMGRMPNIGATKNLRLPEVIGLILPGQRPALRSIELQRLFHSGPDLLHTLSVSGELKKVPQKLSTKGANASPSFTRTSLVKLLENRRIV
jgi:hypothetical protein